MCCLGCKAVADTIVNTGMEDYYKFRETPTGEQPTDVPEFLREASYWDSQAVQQKYISKSLHDNSSDKNLITMQFAIDGMSCAACSWLLEKTLGKVDGIHKIKVNSVSEQCSLQWDEKACKLSELLIQANKVGFTLTPIRFDQNYQNLQNSDKSFLIKIGLAGLGAMQVMMFAVGLYFGFFSDLQTHHAQLLKWASFVIATPIAFYAALPFHKKAWQGIKGKSLGIDVPVSIAILSAYFYSVFNTYTGHGDVYFDSVAMFTFFLLLSRWFQHKTKLKASEYQQKLAKTLPDIAHKLGKEEIELIPSDELLKGDLILIKSGESLPVDGILISEQAHIDEAILTGESKIKEYAKGQSLLAGSINHGQAFELGVSAPANESFVCKLQLKQNEVLSSKSSKVALLDRVARYFVMAILLCALGSGIYWWLHGNEQALWIAISVLVVSCPCALSLAVPAALVASINKLNQQGVLVSRPKILETPLSISKLFFDKTGTITYGKLKVESIETHGDSAPNEVLSIAATLEAQVKHPIANAFTDYAQVNNPTDIRYTHGKGITGIIDTTSYSIGSLDYIREQIPNLRVVDDEKLEYNVGTTVYLANHHQLLATITLADTIKQSAKESLSSLNHDYTNVLLSGDNEAQVARIASELGITEYYAQQLPTQKLAIIENEQKNGLQVAMCGDGVNDGPVLAKADLSIAMGSGSDFAQTSSDFVVRNNELGLISAILKIQRKTQRIIKQNLFWALLYNSLSIPTAMAGLIQPHWAALGMSVSSLVVVLNALRTQR